MRRRRGGHISRAGNRLRPGAAGAALLCAAIALGGCSAIRAASNLVHDVESDRSTMRAFTGRLQSGPTTFVATYVTTGGSPATVVYAVEPSRGLSFTYAPPGTSPARPQFRFLADTNGEYACTPPSARVGARWKCSKLPKTSAADYRNLLDLYTPTHWVRFLDVFALGAGFAGDKLTRSSLDVNGFPMSCVDFTPSGEGTSTICTTADNLLGYVRVAGTSTRFELRRFSTAPAASLFTLPAGATVTIIRQPSVTTSTS